MYKFRIFINGKLQNYTTMQKEKLLKLLQSEQNDIDAIGMILSNYTDFRHSELGEMISEFETVAGILLEWFDRKKSKEVIQCNHEDYEPYYNNTGEFIYKVCIDCGESFEENC